MKKVQTPLFQEITENEWNEMQNCSCMRQQSFEKMNLFFEWENPSEKSELF